MLSAINSGVVTINGNAVVSGGTLTTADTGQFVTTSGQTATLANVVTAGTFNVVNNSNLVLQGTVTNNGSLNLQSGGNSTNLLVSGPVTLAGNGVTNLSNSTANSISAQGAGAQLTVGAGQTIQGSGQFGAGTGIALVNQGTITANQSSPMTIAMTGPVSNASGGLMQAVAGGTLNINSALANNGSLAANGGVVNANAAFNGTGTALISGAGQLNVGASSTVGTLTHNSSAASGLVLGANNITVSGDYTNANAGTGNSFNRRANVTGAGQILAGGDAAQVLTGTGVTNGNTTNATLTLGNVRVGSTTFNYQVANNGSTGPSLRGAIQTNVNGGNLTDARLSGAGVTASNYNTGAPGSNTGNLGVTFTAASAGALAPLSGQVLNLRSNFDNIADQKLNIVLGAGAAAYNAAVGNTTPSPVQVANQRIGGGNTAALTVANTAVAGAFSEDLNASFGTSTGAASGSGSIAGRLAGTNNTGAGAMAVAVNTGSAGAKTGTVTVNYQTAGAVNGVNNGLGTASVGNQVITVNGNVFQSAAGAIQTAALNFGTVQVGQSVSQNLTIRNTATGASGFVEDLNASFGSASGTGAGLISGSGSLNGILAGTNSTAGNGVMTVAVNTAAAGNVAGSIGVNYFTAGAVNGVSNGLGTAAAGSEAYGVNGLIQAAANVINQANPVINNSSINLGNVRIGSASPSAFVSVTNQATIAPQAALNASISGNALITGSGSFNLLAPGATNSNSLQVGMDTSTAGARNGTATISFVSDASNVGNCAPNCQLNIASQNVSVAGGVYRLANAQNVTPSVTLAARVGDAAPSANVSITNQSPDVFTEALKVQAGVAPSGFLVGSNPANIAAQGTGAVQVSLNTATAGTSTGNLTLNHISTGAGTTNAADVSVGSSIVALTGKIYTAAVGAVQSAVNFGIVHVGDVVAAQGVSVQNSAPVTALNDTLAASIGGAAGAFNTNNGVVAGLTAGGAANTTALTVGLSTVTAGIYNGTAFVGLNSHNPDMADLTLASQTVALSGTVNNYANAIFDKVNGSGTLSRVGDQFILDFGTVFQNSGSLSSIIDVDNAVLGPADLLDGSLALLDGNDFASTLLRAGFSGVAAGGTSGDALSFLFDSTALGSFQDAVSLSWFGNNASGYQDQSRLYTLLVRGNVVQQGNTVPEPGTLALLLIAAVGAALARRRRIVVY
ncbi:MAG: choice-of-anchor D domain-containing protein [Rhodoferax sp.]|nr:choice-of-anchor D domain-containing protein [Rhodoferax sp.]